MPKSLPKKKSPAFDTQHSWMPQAVAALAVLALLVIAALIRWYRLPEQLAFTYDQGRDFYVLQQITRSDFTLVGPTTGIAGFFLGPFYYYVLLPGFMLSAGNPLGVMIWLLAITVVSYTLFYFIMVPMVGTAWALTALWWLALNPGAIDQSRAIWNPTLVVPTVLVAVFGLVYSRHWPWLLLLSGLAFGLALQTELAYTLFLLPLLGGWLLWHSPWLSLPKPYSWKIIFITCACVAVTLLPQAMFDVRNQAIMTKSIIRELGDDTKKVPFIKVWRERPIQIYFELKRVMTNDAPGEPVILAGLIGALGLSLWVAWRNQPTKAAAVAAPLTTQLSATSLSAWNLSLRPLIWLWWGYLLLPLVAQLLHRGNYGNFFNYYISAHYLPLIALSIIGLAALPKPKIWITITILVTGIICWRYSALFQPNTLDFALPHQVTALLSLRTHPVQAGPVAVDVFVPNLLPSNYQYLNEWLAQTNQTTPIDFGEKGHTQYFLLYEPASGDGPREEFKRWYKRHQLQANCIPLNTFGIIRTEYCQRKI